MTDSQDFVVRVTLDIRANLEDVWEALTKPEIVEKYMHGTKLMTDWKVGSTIT